ncbi:hypothetical protein AcV5_004166 [Taiwanofungus camphoratus]|nr:hypothetical protein AcV5_004166 [Antrodia cinnamomea]
MLSVCRNRGKHSVYMPQIVPLDDKFYALDAEELAFYKAQTGIHDEDALKQHIMRVQADAYQVHPYNCIRRFNFTRLKISRLPAYSHLLKLGKERAGAIFLDIGCCFGNDARKAVADGYPVQNVVASDLHPEFWALGHTLFNSTPETFPVPFIAGDAFDPAHLPPTPPFSAPPPAPLPAPAPLTSLVPLLGHVSAIHASAFFHLFDEPRQAQLARALAGLLAPAPGSLIFGSHGGRAQKGRRAAAEAESSWRTEPMFCHSPESWAALWDGEVFEKGSVRVEAYLKESAQGEEANTEGPRNGVLVWSVTRL